MNYNSINKKNFISNLLDLILNNKILDLSLLEKWQHTIQSMLETNINTVINNNIFIDSETLLYDNIITIDDEKFNSSNTSLITKILNNPKNETLSKNIIEKIKPLPKLSSNTSIDNTCIKQLNGSSSMSNKKSNSETSSIKRKHGTQIRKKLIEKISNITNKSTLIDIYNNINNDSNTILSSNSNGIFINLNLASDACIDKLMKIYSDYKIAIDKKVSPATNIKNKLYNLDEIEIMTQMGHKLSNQEKLILKRNKY